MTGASKDGYGLSDLFHRTRGHFLFFLPDHTSQGERKLRVAMTATLGTEALLVLQKEKDIVFLEAIEVLVLSASHS